MLAREVAQGLPRRYLVDAFAPGEWRTLRAALDERAEAGGERWLLEAIAGADACFALFRRAAGASTAP